MKNNTFNYFRNAFAIVGFFIIACSVGTADDTTVEPEPPVQSNIGKYQISNAGNDNISVLNTASGEMKTFFKNTQSGNRDFYWVEVNHSKMTFTH